eukprot:gene8444-3978_t
MGRHRPPRQPAAQQQQQQRKKKSSKKGGKKAKAKKSSKKKAVKKSLDIRPRAVHTATRAMSYHRGGVGKMCLHAASSVSSIWGKRTAKRNIFTVFCHAAQHRNRVRNDTNVRIHANNERENGRIVPATRARMVVERFRTAKQEIPETRNEDGTKGHWLTEMRNAGTQIWNGLKQGNMKSTWRHTLPGMVFQKPYTAGGKVQVQNVVANVGGGSPPGQRGWGGSGSPPGQPGGGRKGIQKFAPSASGPTPEGKGGGSRLMSSPPGQRSPNGGGKDGSASSPQGQPGSFNRFDRSTSGSAKERDPGAGIMVLHTGVQEQRDPGEGALVPQAGAPVQNASPSGQVVRYTPYPRPQPSGFRGGGGGKGWKDGKGGGKPPPGRRNWTKGGAWPPQGRRDGSAEEDGPPPGRPDEMTDPEELRALAARASKRAEEMENKRKEQEEQKRKEKEEREKEKQEETIQRNLKRIKDVKERTDEQWDVVEAREKRRLVTGNTKSPGALEYYFAALNPRVEGKWIKHKHQAASGPLGGKLRNADGEDVVETVGTVGVEWILREIGKVVPQVRYVDIMESLAQELRSNIAEQEVKKRVEREERKAAREERKEIAGAGGNTCTRILLTVRLITQHTVEKCRLQVEMAGWGVSGMVPGEGCTVAIGDVLVCLCGPARPQGMRTRAPCRRRTVGDPAATPNYPQTTTYDGLLLPILLPKGAVTTQSAPHAPLAAHRYNKNMEGRLNEGSTRGECVILGREENVAASERASGRGLARAGVAGRPAVRARARRWRRDAWRGHWVFRCVHGWPREVWALSSKARNALVHALNGNTAQGWRAGDFTCKKCAGHNFAWRQECKFCGERRPAAKGSHQKPAPGKPPGSAGQGWQYVGPPAGGEARRDPTRPDFLGTRDAFVARHGPREGKRLWREAGAAGSPAGGQGKGPAGDRPEGTGEERRPDPEHHTQKAFTRAQFEDYYGPEAGRRWRKAGKLPKKRARRPAEARREQARLEQISTAKERRIAKLGEKREQAQAEGGRVQAAREEAGRAAGLEARLAEEVQARKAAEEREEEAERQRAAAQVRLGQERIARDAAEKAERAQRAGLEEQLARERSAQEELKKEANARLEGLRSKLSETQQRCEELQALERRHRSRSRSRKRKQDRELTPPAAGAGAAGRGRPPGRDGAAAAGAAGEELPEAIPARAELEGRDADFLGRLCAKHKCTPAWSQERKGAPWVKACLDRLEQRRAETLEAAKRPAAPPSPERVPPAKVGKGSPSKNGGRGGGAGGAKSPAKGKNAAS